jgi:Lipopolysaccharide-assembly
MNVKVVFNFIKVVLCSILIIPSIFSLSGCAYRLSTNVDQIPGNYKTLFVPLFENNSNEPNVEVVFTNSLKTELLRFSRIHITNSKDQAEATLSGVIKQIDIKTEDSVIEARDSTYLPFGTVLPTQVKVSVITKLTLTENKTKKMIWEGEYVQSKNYTPPQINLPILNSANNNYNLSERRQTINAISKEMMQLALDRLVDNF